MSQEVDQLVKFLGMDKEGKKPRSEHHLQGRIFPFHTRASERVKFTTSFNEIIGIIARTTLDKELILKDVREEHAHLIVDKLEFIGDISDQEVEQLFQIDFNNMTNPVLIQYYPVALETKSEQVESKGKALLGYYITKLLRLDENEEWKTYISMTGITDLYEELYIGCLPQINERESRKDNFHFFNQDKLVTMFNKDLNQLMRNDKFFLNDIKLLISYYFFYYILEQTLLMTSYSDRKVELWFSYDKEKVTAGRDSIKKGYRVFNEVSKELLINNDLLDYINVLSGNDSYRMLKDILEDVNNLPKLQNNLLLFNQLFSESTGEAFDSKEDVLFQIKQLKGYLKQNTAYETVNRYRKSFDEFSNLGFIKSRGRLGYTLNATQELVIMFVGVIIGSREKILLNKLFLEFEERGIYFDKKSRKELISFFEDINILEKLSDSGDAQYVKSIL